MRDGAWQPLSVNSFNDRAYTDKGPLLHHEGSDFSIEWTGATQPSEESYFALQDSLIGASRAEDLRGNITDYSAMPVNLVAGFENGDISYNLLASLYRFGTGNQVLDGITSQNVDTKSLI